MESLVIKGGYRVRELRVEPAYDFDGAAWLAIGQRGETREGDANSGIGLKLDHDGTVKLYEALGRILAGE